MVIMSSSKRSAALAANPSELPAAVDGMGGNKQVACFQRS